MLAGCRFSFQAHTQDTGVNCKGLHVLCPSRLPAENREVQGLLSVPMSQLFLSGYTNVLHCTVTRRCVFHPFCRSFFAYSGIA